MLDFFLSNLTWALQLPLLPFYYHLPEWFWLAISLDKIGAAFETYGVYLLGLSATSVFVYKRNTLLTPFINTFNVAKLRSATRVSYQLLNVKAQTIKTVLNKLFK